MSWLIAIIVTALPPPEPTHPAFLDAARLQAVCADDGPDAASAKLLCMGYVMGVADQLLARPSRRGGPSICLSADFTPRAAVEAVQRRAPHIRTTEGVGAAEFVRSALERAYPCPINRSRR
jgi:hypothetical protein